MDLIQLQFEVFAWARNNFGQGVRHQPLLGATEELGELAHAHLKMEQEIRGLNRAEYERLAHDALGDIVIYLADYAAINGLNLEHAVQDTWSRVKQRDWRKDPTAGGEKDTEGSEPQLQDMNEPKPETVG